MTSLWVAIGWIMIIGGSAAVLVSRLFLDNLFESDTKNQLFNAFRPHVFGAGLLVAVLGGIVLNANGVHFDWLSSN